MNVLIRVDQSELIGSGHYQRCLSLAIALYRAGASVSFVARHLNEIFQSLLLKYGFNLVMLPCRRSEPDRIALTGDYAGWLGVSEELDADDCRVALAGQKYDVILVDHYALGQTWERQMRDHAETIVVIDDLVNRGHDCDVLIDQTYGRCTSEYAHLVPRWCKVLAGVEYALLRDEFKFHRMKSLVRKRRFESGRLLISLGGVDRDNITERLLSEGRSWIAAANLEVTVILGAGAPHASSVRDVCEKNKWTFLHNKTDMAGVITNHDFCMGAAGSSTWERFCLGIPALVLKLADNQSEIIKKLVNDGLVRELNVNNIMGSLDDLEGIWCDRYLSENSADISKLVDGLGCRRVVTAIKRKIDAP